MDSIVNNLRVLFIWIPKFYYCMLLIFVYYKGIKLNIRAHFKSTIIFVVYNKAYSLIYLIPYLYWNYTIEVSSYYLLINKNIITYNIRRKGTAITIINFKL
jgi:hypothetical protein